MGTIGVQHLREGMVLAADLLAPNGRFILPKGGVIKKAYLSTLKAWGVVEAEVEGDPGPEASEPPLSPKLLDHARELVERYFPPSRREGPLMEELYRICLRRTAERMEQRLPLPGEEEGLVDPEFRGGSLPRSKGGDLTPRDLAQNDRFLASFPDIYFRITEVLNAPKQLRGPHLRGGEQGPQPVRQAPEAGEQLLLRLLLPHRLHLPGGWPSSGATSCPPWPWGSPSSPPSRMCRRPTSPCGPSGCTPWPAGVFARLLSTRREAAKEEHFFLAGLLHDLGRLVLYRRVPFSMAQALQEAARRGVGVHEAEREVLGFDHASVGYQILKEWRIPPSLAEAVRFHHNPGASEAPYEPAVLHVADLLALGCRFGSSGSFVVPELREEARDLLDLSPNALDPLILQAERQVREISGVFFE